MTDILLDQFTNDVVVENGDLVFIDSKEFEARQAITMTLRAFRGEWFKDILYGTPWIKNDDNAVSILNKVPKNVFDSYIRESILSNTEALSIISYSSLIDSYSGAITIAASVETEFGVIEILEEI